MRTDHDMHEEVLIYLLQNRQRAPVDVSLMAEDFSGAHPNPLVLRDLRRGHPQEETAAHQAMQARLLTALGGLEERGLVELEGSLLVVTRRARLTPAGRARAEVCLEQRRKRELR